MITENYQLHSIKFGQDIVNAPVHLVAPDCDHGLVDCPGVGVETDTDLQGNVWMMIQL